MRYKKRKKCGHLPKLSHGLPIACGALLALAGGRVFAQDDYLRALEQEADKISSGPTSVVSGEGGPAHTQVASDPKDVNREQFEGLLQKEYRGTFAFYKQLLPSTREEIFIRFERGTPMTELRGLIVERYLQR